MSRDDLLGSGSQPLLRGPQVLCEQSQSAPRKNLKYTTCYAKKGGFTIDIKGFQKIL